MHGGAPSLGQSVPLLLGHVLPVPAVSQQVSTHQMLPFILLPLNKGTSYRELLFVGWSLPHEEIQGFVTFTLQYSLDGCRQTREWRLAGLAALGEHVSMEAG